MALVDHTRNVNRHYPVADYDSKTTEMFGDEHVFIKCLRHYVNHNRTAPLAWRQRWDFSTSNARTEFNLSTHTLLETGQKWTAPAKRYLSSQPKEINVKTLFEGYRGKATSFHSWFIDTLEAIRKEELADYGRYVRFLNALESRSFWNLMIQQIKGGGLDVNDYIDRYLTPEEIEQFNQLSPDTRRQADYVIATLDDYGACDDAMRAQVYSIFKVPEVT